MARDDLQSSKVIDETCTNNMINRFSFIECLIGRLSTTINFLGQIVLLVTRGPLEMLGGIVVGALFGYALWHLPNSVDVRKA